MGVDQGARNKMNTASVKFSHYEIRFTQWEPSPPWCLFEFLNGDNSFTVQITPEEVPFMIDGLVALSKLVLTEKQINERRGY